MLQSVNVVSIVCYLIQVTDGQVGGGGGVGPAGVRREMGGIDRWQKVNEVRRAGILLTGKDVEKGGDWAGRKFINRGETSYWIAWKGEFLC